MAEQEIDTIKHLIEMERAASLLISEAQGEADKKIARALAGADASFRERTAAIVSEKEAAYEAKTKEASARHDGLLSEYKARIGRSPLSAERFNDAVEAYLFS